MSALLLILMSFNGVLHLPAASALRLTQLTTRLPESEHPIIDDWRQMEASAETGEVALQIIRDSRVLSHGNDKSSGNSDSWRVRFDRDNMRIDGILQWIDLQTNRPARVPDRIADIEFGRDYGNSFSTAAKYFESRPISVVLNSKTKWNAGLRELDKSLIDAWALVIRPISTSWDRLHSDQRTYRLQRVAGPASDYLVVQDMRQTKVVRDIWVDPARRHRITRVIAYLQEQPILQVDYEYADESTLPSQWIVMRLDGQKIIDFAAVKCTHPAIMSAVPPETFVLPKGDAVTKASQQDAGGAKRNIFNSLLAIAGFVLAAIIMRRVTSSAKATVTNKPTDHN